MMLFYSLGIIFLTSIGIYFFIWKNRLNDKQNLGKDWQNFLNSESTNDIKGIAQNGDKLIWNKYLQNDQLNKIIEVIDSRINDYPELKKLKNNAFNKKLHYDRVLPY